MTDHAKRKRAVARRRSPPEAVRRNAYWRMFGMDVAFLALGVAIISWVLIRMVRNARTSVRGDE
jgi:hypothetical protein